MLARGAFIKLAASMTFRHQVSANDSQLFTLRNFSILLGALLAIWYWPVIVGGQTFIYRDFGYFGFPLAVHHREAFWNGELPLWNPLNHCGIPFLAQWNTLTLYPGALIYLLLPVEAALAWFDLFHLWLAGVGMFLLARAWYSNPFAAAVAGLGFAISGLSFNFLLWPNNIAALAWMPFVIWLTLENSFLRAVLVGSLQMLTGAPEVILLTWAILFALTVIKSVETKSFSAGKQFAAVALVVALLCAVQLLPFLDLARISQRHRDFGGAFWSMPLSGWMNYFVPLLGAFHLSSGVSFQEGQLWTSSYYPSIAITFLTLHGLFTFKQRFTREKCLYAISFLALLLALGPAGYVYTIFKNVVPGLGLIRFPVKFVIVPAFAMPLLAAAALQNFDEHRRKTTWRAITLIVLALVVFCFLRPRFANIKVVAWSGGLTYLFATATAICLAGVRVRKFQIALLVLMPLDIWLSVGNVTPTIDRDALRGRSEFAGRAMLSREAFDTLYNETIQDTRKNFLLNRTALNADLNLVDRVAKVDGFFSLNTAWGERLRNQLYAKGQGNLDNIMDFMGVTRFTSTNSIFEWTARTNAMPLVTAGQSPRFLEETNCLYALFDPRFLPREKVVFFEKFDGYETNRINAEVSNVKRTDHTISFEVNASKPTFAVVAESFDPNWRATLNGAATRIIRSNYAFQAVQIPAGKTVVELKYVDRAFQIGLGISLATLIGLFALAFRS